KDARLERSANDDADRLFARPRQEIGRALVEQRVAQRKQDEVERAQRKEAVAQCQFVGARANRPNNAAVAQVAKRAQPPALGQCVEMMIDGFCRLHVPEAEIVNDGAVEAIDTETLQAVLDLTADSVMGKVELVDKGRRVDEDIALRPPRIWAKAT